MNMNFYAFRPLTESRGRFNPYNRSYRSVFDYDDQNLNSYWTPAVDIKEEDNHFAIVADVPGVNPNDIEITAQQSVLMIRGERHSDSIEKAGRYHHLERGWGRFERRFNLPDTADTDQIQARSESGVLAVIIPKKETARPRRIEVTH